MQPQFEIVTGEDKTLGPFTQQQLHDEIKKIPVWICFDVRLVERA